MKSYEDFIATKLVSVPPTGMRDVPPLSDVLFTFQRDLVTWALRRGRAALFASTGLGKTRMQIEWALHVQAATNTATVDGFVLILAPLAVGAQTVAEAATLGVTVTQVRESYEVTGPGIYITNYDRLHKFSSLLWTGVVCDESSIFKHFDSGTLKKALEAFRDTPWKLCATATPSPNDYTELGTHAEFLGICSRTEMLAEFFCHDGGETQKWRLKGHARQAFWRWVASWAALVRMPSDLGYDDGAYQLPPLVVKHHQIPADPESVKQGGLLFAEPAKTLTERRTARRGSLGPRVSLCLDEVARQEDERWIVWCDLNAEQNAIEEELGSRCFSIYGTLDVEEKESRLSRFLRGERRVMVSKPKIAGFGVNAQSVARMAFVGVTDSFESYYQAVRRIWRFGQTRECEVHVFASELEGNVIENLKRKSADAEKMGEELSRETSALVREEVQGQARTTNIYSPKRAPMPAWLTARPGDCE